MNESNRRRFLVGSASIAALSTGLVTPAITSGIEPISRTHPSRLNLGLAAYSLRDLLTKPESGWDLFKFIDYCHEQDVLGAELTSYYFPNDVTDDYLVELKQHCHRQGVLISGGAIRNDFCQQDPAKLQKDIEHTKTWIDRYAILGAPSIRIFAGNQPPGEEIQETIARCVKACDEVGAYAHSKGVYLGLENHGGVTAKADGLLEIVRQVNSKSFGINLDSGNFHSTADPYAELAQIAPYAINAQIKVDIFPNGKHELTDLGRVVEILKNARYSGWVVLEYEAKPPALEAIPTWIAELKHLLNA